MAPSGRELCATLAQPENSVICFLWCYVGSAGKAVKALMGSRWGRVGASLGLQGSCTCMSPYFLRGCSHVPQPTPRSPVVLYAFPVLLRRLARRLSGQGRTHAMSSHFALPPIRRFAQASSTCMDASAQLLPYLVVTNPHIKSVYDGYRWAHSGWPGWGDARGNCLTIDAACGSTSAEPDRKAKKMSVSPHPADDLVPFAGLCHG